MDLTRRQFGKAVAGAAAAFVLPVGFVLEESKEETLLIDSQFFVSFVAPPKPVTKQVFENKYLFPALSALRNHMKIENVRRVGKITVRKIYDINNDQEVFGIDAFTTSTKGLSPRVINRLGEIDLQRLRLGQEVSTITKT